MTMTIVNSVVDLHCWRCNRKLAEKVTPPYDITCARCHATNKKDASDTSA